MARLLREDVFVDVVTAASVSVVVVRVVEVVAVDEVSFVSADVRLLNNFL